MNRYNLGTCNWNQPGACEAVRSYSFVENNGNNSLTLLNKLIAINHSNFQSQDTFNSNSENNSIDTSKQSDIYSYNINLSRISAKCVTRNFSIYVYIIIYNYIHDTQVTLRTTIKKGNLYFKMPKFYSTNVILQMWSIRGQYHPFNPSKCPYLHSSFRHTRNVPNYLDKSLSPLLDRSGNWNISRPLRNGGNTKTVLSRRDGRRERLRSWGTS